MDFTLSEAGKLKQLHSVAEQVRLAPDQVNLAAPVQTQGSTAGFFAQRRQARAERDEARGYQINAKQVALAF
ncbi:MAG TPA: hypothetical protein VNH83_03095, partial [Bryobacteraceae bacterium]|nr:hypothetical protein [Bryobacteraceae bacterium]